VDRRANKIEIKQAVEYIFHVNVTHVRTMNVPGKLKKQGRTSGMTAQWKKAVVTLKEGQTLPIFDE
jgi:large subunit ribosomal protein L23